MKQKSTTTKKGLQQRLKIPMMTDVTDCEDDPCDANGSGGDEEVANIIGEFDDGY